MSKAKKHGKKCVTKEGAERTVLALVNQKRQNGEELVIVGVAESDQAWAFSYNTRSFAGSGDVMRSLIGNGPVIVSKLTGQVTRLPSSYGRRDALRVWQTYDA